MALEGRAPAAPCTETQQGQQSWCGHPPAGSCPVPFLRGLSTLCWCTCMLSATAGWLGLGAGGFCKPLRWMLLVWRCRDIGKQLTPVRRVGVPGVVLLPQPPGWVRRPPCEAHNRLAQLGITVVPCLSLVCQVRSGHHQKQLQVAAMHAAGFVLLRRQDCVQRAGISRGWRQFAALQVLVFRVALSGMPSLSC